MGYWIVEFFPTLLGQGIWLMGTQEYQVGMRRYAQEILHLWVFCCRIEYFSASHSIYEIYVCKFSLIYVYVYMLQVTYNSLSWCKTWMGSKVNITRAPQVLLASAQNIKMNSYSIILIQEFKFAVVVFNSFLW